MNELLGNYWELVNYQTGLKVIDVDIMSLENTSCDFGYFLQYTLTLQVMLIDLIKC